MGKDDVDVDAGAQDIMFGCATRGIDCAMPDGISFEEEID